MFIVSDHIMYIYLYRMQHHGANIVCMVKLLCKGLFFFLFFSKPWSGCTWICPAFANSVDTNQLASEEASWSGSAQFVIKYVNLCQQSGSSNLIGWKLEVGVPEI